MVSFEGAAMPGHRSALTLEETINDPEAPLPGQALARAEEVQGLKQAIAILPEKERTVLSLYYYEELNLRQIAEILHVTESRISQIRTQALRRHARPADRPEGGRVTRRRLWSLTALACLAPRVAGAPVRVVGAGVRLASWPRSTPCGPRSSSPGAGCRRRIRGRCRSPWRSPRS